MEKQLFKALDRAFWQDPEPIIWIPAAGQYLSLSLTLTRDLLTPWLL